MTGGGGRATAGPGLPIALPPGKPNTKPAIEQAALLLRQDSSRAMEFVRWVYRAFWCEGHDISDVLVLKRLTGEPVADGTDEPSRRIVQEWEAAWHATEQAGVPLIVSPAGDFLVGCVPLEEIRRFFA